MSGQTDELLDLLVARATEGVSAEDETKLAKLLADSEEHDSEGVELAAAAATNAFALRSGRGKSMPAGLKDRLLTRADSHFASNVSRPPASVTDLAEARARRSVESGDGGSAPRTGLFNRLGWAVAAALLVALFIVNRPETVETGRADIPVQARAEALESRPGTMIVPWSPPEIEDYIAVTGDVVWNNETQEGYLRLAGMPSNDPSVAQYQLWIVDPERDSRPVDGGVFDVPPGAGKVVVPINAKLGIIDPQAFAITLEQPGGVVVSDGPLLVVASAG